MNKLDDLINKFCPDGVEYKKLGILSKQLIQNIGKMEQYLG